MANGGLPSPGAGAEKSDPLSVSLKERDKDILGMVRRALEEDRVMLAFQPVVQARKQDRPAFYEGLIRILDGSGRIIPAGEFIGAVETDEIGRMIDCAALKHGLDALSQEPTLRLSINMSARSIGYQKWNRILNRRLRHDPTLGERLILEITERSAIVMPELVKTFMTDLQEQGVSFALDDFGSGYTSFTYLRDFYFDILKIDGQFMRGIHANPDNQVLVRAIISLANHFDMLTVAEFIETEQDARMVADFGIDCLQGYFFGKPTVKPFWMNDDRQKQIG